METIDLAKDPYLLRTHLGTIECRLCLTLHTNEGSYLAHTQGKKHQTNLARRAARESKDTSVYAQQLQAQQAAVKNQVQKKQFIKIGSPGYQITKVKDPITGQLGLLFQIHYPKIAKNVKPVQRFMSAFEQQVETADREHQYLVVRQQVNERCAPADTLFRLPQSRTRRYPSRFSHERSIWAKGGHGTIGTQTVRRTGAFRTPADATRTDGDVSSSFQFLFM